MDSISAYHVNQFGILCYAGLPTQHDDLLFKHHNGVPYSTIQSKYSYEVGSVTEHGLIHGYGRKFDNYIK